MNKNGGPAFPYSALQPDPETRSIVGSMYADNEGMTLRDYFAAAAMQGLIASNDANAGDRMDDIPKYAYDIADAMLKARENER